MELEITNISDQSVEVAHVRLEGEMIGLIFLTYDTGVSQTLAPGERREIVFPLDFFDLRGQAHGLLRARLRLFDADRQPLGARDLVVDGRGGRMATTGMFTLVLAVAAALSLVWNLAALARRALPSDRFARAARFAATGLLVGLALSAASSTLRIWPLAATVWGPLTVVVAVGALVVGYLSPGRIRHPDELDVPDGGRPVLDLTGPGLGSGPGLDTVTGADPGIGSATGPGPATPVAAPTGPPLGSPPSTGAGDDGPGVVLGP